MIQWIVSDLDGTLLGHDQKIRQLDADALRRAMEAGLHLCIATGRMISEIRQVMLEISNPYYAISQNGAFIHSDQGILLDKTYFEMNLLDELLAEVAGHPFVQTVSNERGNFITEQSPHSDRIRERMFYDFLIEPNLHLLVRDNELNGAKVSFFGDLHELRQLENRLNKRFAGKVQTFVSDHDCLDIMPLSVSKGSSLLKLLKQLQLHPSEVACIGDSFNDISMFHVSPHSFAIASAHPNVLKYAEHAVQSVAECLDWVQQYNRR